MVYDGRRKGAIRRMGRSENAVWQVKVEMHGTKALYTS